MLLSGLGKRCAEIRKSLYHAQATWREREREGGVFYHSYVCMYLPFVSFCSALRLMYYLFNIYYINFQSKIVNLYSFEERNASKKCMVTFLLFCMLIHISVYYHSFPCILPSTSVYYNPPLCILLVTLLVYYQPPQYSTIHCPMCILATSSLCILPSTSVYYHPVLHTTSHLCKLPSTSVYYQQPMYTTIHLCILPSSSAYYQPPL